MVDKIFDDTFNNLIQCQCITSIENQSKPSRNLKLERIKKISGPLPYWNDRRSEAMYKEINIGIK